MSFFHNIIFPTGIDKTEYENYYQFKYGRFCKVTIQSTFIVGLVSLIFFFIDAFLFGEASWPIFGLRFFPFLLQCVFLYFYKVRKRDDSYIGMVLCSGSVVFTTFITSVMVHMIGDYTGFIGHSFILYQFAFIMICLASPIPHNLISLSLYLAATAFVLRMFGFGQSSWMLILLVLIYISSIYCMKQFDNAVVHAYKLNEEVHSLMLHDPLTGLYNRNKFNDLKKIIEAENISAAVMMMDIDFFKVINDTYGHAAGDKILVFTGTLAKRVVGDQATVIRYGGEEFLIIMENASLEKAHEVATEIVQTIANTSNSVEPVTVSIGIATHTHGSLDSSINLADQALYKAKRNGRNRVEEYPL